MPTMTFSVSSGKVTNAFASARSVSGVRVPVRVAVMTGSRRRRGGDVHAHALGRRDHLEGIGQAHVQKGET